MKQIQLYILFFLGLVTASRGQYYSTGQDPASIRWFQIKTDSFRIVFPENFESQSQRLAQAMTIVSMYETGSLKARVPKMPVLIHTRSAESNGLTIWAPHRIELYSCPPQDIYPEEWLEQLAIHEYRHAVQIASMNRGFTKALYYILGEQAAGAVLGLYIPRWFLEGDATVTETALSSSGRGRVAAFTAPLRAQLLQKGIYSYDMATMGSFKTFTPDPYVLGYHLVAKGREQFGPGLWNHTLGKVAKLPFIVVPFNTGIRQKTGLWKKRLYQKTMEELLVEWQQQEDNSWQSAFERITTPDRSDYTTWDRPQYLNDSTLVVARWSNEGVACLISLDPSGRSHRILRLGSYQPGSLSVSGNAAVWTEYRPDIRWENRSYSVIRILSVPTPVGAYPVRAGLEPAPFKSSIGTYPVGAGLEPAPTPDVCDLTRKTRYFSPSLSPDGSRILAVRTTDMNRSVIDILDIATGDILDSIPAPEDGLFLQPAWSPDGKGIAFIFLTREGKSLRTIKLSDASQSVYIAPSFRDIQGPPLFFRNYILFMAGYNGTGNIYAVDTLSRRLFQVTSARFNASSPSISPDGATIVYTDYCADGTMVVSMDSDPSGWIALDSIPCYTFELAEKMARQEGVNVQDSLRTKDEGRITGHQSPVSSLQSPVTRYRKFPHLFNLHSWAPVSIDADNLNLNPGVSVLSQNLLSTAFAGAGYMYDLNERTGKFYLNFSYKGWFPVVDLGYSYGKRAGTGRYSNTGETFRFTWNESSLEASVSVPLNLSRGLWYRGIHPSISTSWIYVIHDRSTPDVFIGGAVNTVNYRLYLYNHIRSNYQDVYPKWGQNLDIQYRHSPFGQNDPGHIFAISSTLYFPGFLPHHGVRIYGGYQQRTDHQLYGYQFANILTFPRGSIAFYSPGMTSFSAGYKFPFLRLDASLGSVLYIKRFTLNLFYDRSHGWGPGEDTFSESTGAEFLSELHILRFIAPFEIGIQGAWLPHENLWTWRFLWGISL